MKILEKFFDKETKEKLAKFNRRDEIYRFWRRYLIKNHPLIYKKICVETLSAEEILEKAKLLLPKEYGIDEKH